MGAFTQVTYRRAMLLASALTDFGAIFLEAQTWSVTGRSLIVSATASFLAMDLGLIFASLLLRATSRLARFFDALVSAFVAIPAVVIGLLALLFFSSSLFAETRITLSLIPMITAQTLLLTPLATTLILQVLRTRDSMLGEELQSLGAKRGQAFDVLLRETWPALLVTAVLVFARGIAEVGTVLIVGGNVAGRTQVLTTLIAEQARNGAYETAMALALILIVLALALSLLARYLQHRAEAA